MATTPDTGAINAGNILENILGVASDATDVWKKWQTAKVDNLERKAAIPTTAGNTANNAISPFWNSSGLMIGGAIAAGLVLVLVLGRKS